MRTARVADQKWKEVKQMGSIDNHHNYGIVRNIENDIVGFNLSPDLFVGFTHEDIFKALERYAKEKVEQDKFLNICSDIASRINNILEKMDGDADGRQRKIQDETHLS